MTFLGSLVAGALMGTFLWFAAISAGARVKRRPTTIPGPDGINDFIDQAGRDIANTNRHWLD